MHGGGVRLSGSCNQPLSRWKSGRASEKCGKSVCRSLSQKVLHCWNRAEIHIRVFKRIVSTKYGSKPDCREGWRVRLAQEWFLSGSLHSTGGCQKHNQGSWGAGRDDAPDSQKQLLLLHPGWSAEYNIQDRKKALSPRIVRSCHRSYYKFKPIHFKNIWLFYLLRRYQQHRIWIVPAFPEDSGSSRFPAVLPRV